MLETHLESQAWNWPYVIHTASRSIQGCTHMLQTLHHMTFRVHCSCMASYIPGHTHVQNTLEHRHTPRERESKPYTWSAPSKGKKRWSDCKLSMPGRSILSCKYEHPTWNEAHCMHASIHNKVQWCKSDFACLTAQDSKGRLPDPHTQPQRHLISQRFEKSLFQESLVSVLYFPVRPSVRYGIVMGYNLFFAYGCKPKTFTYTAIPIPSSQHAGTGTLVHITFSLLNPRRQPVYTNAVLTAFAG